MQTSNGSRDAGADQTAKFTGYRFIASRPSRAANVCCVNATELAGVAFGPRVFGIGPRGSTDRTRPARSTAGVPGQPVT